MTTCVKRLFFLLVLGALALQPSRLSAQARQVAVEGDHFVVNWGSGPQARFLLFISYFDGMRADPAKRNADLAYIRNTLQFDGIRIFPNWQRRNLPPPTSQGYCAMEWGGRLMDGSGNIVAEAFDRLVQLIEAARAQQLVVDVSFSFETFDPVLTPADFAKGVKAAAALLKPYSNLVFDMQNEAGLYDAIFSDTYWQTLRADIFAIDKQRIVTISKGDEAFHRLIDSSVIAIHDPRTSTWYDDVDDVVAGTRTAGQAWKPVYLQEPTAWNSGLRICNLQEGVDKDADGVAAHFQAAVTNARAGGAAAWTFHTRQGFRLDIVDPNDSSSAFWKLIDNNSTERNMLLTLRGLADTGTWGLGKLLSTSLLGSGAGTLSSDSPSILQCGEEGKPCVASFAPNQVVVLRATAKPGSTFAGWGGACLGAGTWPTCSVTMDAARSVTATFNAAPQGPALAHSIDAPQANAVVTSPFLVGGWALDQNAAVQPGVASVKVWAKPVATAATQEVATAAFGGSRPDVPCNCAFNASVFLPKGDFDLYLVVTFTGGSTTQSPFRRVTVAPPTNTDSRRAGNFDGDSKSEITVYNTTSGAWAALLSGGNYLTALNKNWGGTGYDAVPGDYDGDGRTDIGVYQASSGNWYVLLSGTNYLTSLSKNVGGSGWSAKPGDYDGDGLTDFVVYNASSGQWYGLKSSSNYTTTVNVFYGGSGYTPVTGDFDGDGKTDLGVYNDTTGAWSVLLATSNFTTSLSANNGGTGWVPVPADFDGDGKTDFATYNTTSGQWYALKSGSSGSISVSWGGTNYTAVKGDYDGDGKADLATYVQASGNWYILLSGTGYTSSISKNLGGAGWIALPKFP